MRSKTPPQAGTFIEGPAGSGKTAFGAEYLRDLLNSPIQGNSILIVVPQQHLAAPYQTVIHAEKPIFKPVITTHSSFARQMLQRFWPLVAQKIETKAQQEPSFASVSLAQYYMLPFVKPAIESGLFDSIYVSQTRLITQIIDNMNKSALAALSLEQAEARLIKAWGERHSSRELVYKTATKAAQQYQKFCLEHGVLDFALQINLFHEYLLREPAFIDYFQRNFSYLIADNLDEMGARDHDFLEWMIPMMTDYLLIYDHDGGYRVFLGADAENGYQLVRYCQTQREFTPPSNGLGEIISEIDSVYALDTQEETEDDENVHIKHTAIDLSALHFVNSKFYHEMISRCLEHVHTLLTERQVPPGQIAIMAPYLNDSLRYSLEAGFAHYNIPAFVYRPSRPMQSEPRIKAVLTCLCLAYPEWNIPLPASDIAACFHLLIQDLDLIRATLLANIVYKGGLGSFTTITNSVQSRITAQAGERYERLRAWLANADTNVPPDYFLSRLFGELLTQPGFGFHGDLSAGRYMAELVTTARQFRSTVTHDEDWPAVTYEFYQLIQQGVISAQALNWSNYQPGQAAVLVSPAHAFLMLNQPVDHQLWLDAGNSSWWERIEQPLTHPYVLRRSYPNEVWTDEHETKAQDESLRRIVLGLLRRCRQEAHIFISEISETGYEQQGPLLMLFQRLLSRSAD